MGQFFFLILGWLRWNDLIIELDGLGLDFMVQGWSYLVDFSLNWLNLLVDFGLSLDWLILGRLDLGAS